MPPDPVYRAEADHSGRRFELLATIGERLGDSLDPTVTVQGIADALVPAFADWCVVDLLGEDRSLQPVATAHQDPALTPEIARLRSEYPPQERVEPAHPIYRAIDRDTTIVEVVSDDELQRRAVDEAHLALLRKLGIGSHVVIALESRGRVIGAISIIRRPEREPFSADEVFTAEELARRAALATDNAQLYRAAQAAIELRDRFIGVASHELRNPLGVVNGHWELLGRRLGRVSHAIPADDLEKINLSMVRLGQGIDQLRRLVEELLDVRRMTSGKMEIRPSEIDLAAVIRQAVAEIPDAAAASRVQLDLPPNPIVGSWDRGRLEQVVANLLANALKYSPPHKRVEVALEEFGSLVRMRVIDAGIGIPPEDLESVFEPFTRGRNAEAHHYPGLGLGLAVSREVIVMHGGRMWAESDGEGSGSTFIVELDRQMT